MLTLRHRNGRDLGGQEGVLILFKSNKLKSLRLLRQKKNDWIFLEYLSHGLMGSWAHGPTIVV